MASGFWRTETYSSGQAGVWGVSGSGYVYYRMGVTAKRPKGRYWKRVSGRLKQIDSGPRGIVCGENKYDYIYCRLRISSRYRRGRKWVRVPGKLKYISCGEYGYWGVNKANKIYFRQGVSRSNPMGLKWRNVGENCVKSKHGNPVRFGVLVLRAEYMFVPAFPHPDLGVLVGNT